MQRHGGAGRALLAATAAASLIGIAIQVVVSAGNDDGLFPTAAGRVFNVFCYFTVQSNLLVAVTSILLLVRVERPSLLFRALRLTGLIAIIVTFAIYHTALSNLVELDGWAKVADQLVHTVAPAAWVAFTLVRGELIGFYPYPFVDVDEYGYGRIVLNIALVGVLFYALARGAVWLDGRLGSRRSR